MKVFDFTAHLKPKIKTSNNYYCFNPGLAHYKEDLYVCVYRSIEYNLPKIHHPWQIWNAHYRLFSNAQTVIDRKYRSNTGSSHCIPFHSTTDLTISDELDSTSLAILSIVNDCVSVVDVVCNIFGSEMNQDTRIMKVDNNRFLLTYNVFVIQRSLKLIVQKYRYLTIVDDTLQLSVEEEMFSNRKAVEKNCTFDLRGNIIYQIYPQFSILNKNGHFIVQKECIHFKPMVDHYGNNNVLISGGTPPIAYRNHYLALGHLKVRYKEIEQTPPFSYFYHLIKTKNLQLQGTFIYFCFFYEFNEQYEITRVSQPFIPESNLYTMQYALAFPMGIVYQKDQIIVSYGEGDCRCKLLMLPEIQLERLLVNQLDLGFYLLTNKASVFHQGYFNEYNCGDDSFVDVFQYLHRTCYPQLTVTTGSSVDANNDLLVLGGGDVINQYFMNEVKKCNHRNMIAVGVGLPYLSEKRSLAYFKHSILRSLTDYHRLKEYYPLSYYPDLTFLLPEIFPVSPEKKFTTNIKHIGFSLTQTIYHASYVKEYDCFLQQICTTIRLLLADNYVIHLIPFGINQAKNTENDLIIYRLICEQIHSPKLILEYTADYNADNYTLLTYRKIAQMDFMICSRYHSHIFSLMNNVPFISLTCGRKCIEWMKEIDFTNNLYQLNTNAALIPIHLNGEVFYQFIKNRLTHIFDIVKKTAHLQTIYLTKMRNFKTFWNNLICDNLNENYRSLNVQLYPNDNRSIHLK